MVITIIETIEEAGAISHEVRIVRGDKRNVLNKVTDIYLTRLNELRKEYPNAEITEDLNFSAVKELLIHNIKLKDGNIVHSFNIYNNENCNFRIRTEIIDV